MKASPKKLVFAGIGVFMGALLLLIALGDNGLVEMIRLRAAHQDLLETNMALTRENMQLYRAIDRLQNDPDYVETVARRELGMIRADEVIFKFKTSPQAQ